MVDQTDVRAIAAALRRPFKPDELEWRVGSTNSEKTRGLALAYVTNRAIQNRLDDVVGIENWRNEYKEWKEKGILCGLTVRIAGEWITKWDGADETDVEAVKGGFSDSMKRAAYQWGIGRYLYEMPQQWAPIEQRGRTAVFAKDWNPTIPAWALPDGAPTKPERPAAPPSPVESTRPTLPLPVKREDAQIKHYPDEVITEPQRKQMWSIAKKAMWTEGELRKVVKQYGYDSMKDIKVKDYDTICAVLEGGPVDPPAEGAEPMAEEEQTPSPAADAPHPNKSPLTAALCKSIYIQAGNLGMKHDDVHRFARHLFQDPNIDSLYDLGTDKAPYQQVLEALAAEAAKRQAS